MPNFNNMNFVNVISFDSKELFYQKMIFNFGNVGCIQFDVRMLS